MKITVELVGMAEGFITNDKHCTNDAVTMTTKALENITYLEF